MPLDMTQFHQVFFDETAEHLSTMESLLFYLDPQAPDPEQLDDLGRAAHSIKGAGGTFGFRDLATLAEAAESLVWDVRKGNRRLSGELVGALREACGALRALLAGYRGDGVPEPDAATRAMALLRGLSTDGGGGKVSPGGTARDPVLQSGALRELGEAIERNAALVERAADNVESLRESFRALVRAIAVPALSSPGSKPASGRLAQSHRVE